MSDYARKCAENLKWAAYYLPADERGYTEDGDPQNCCTDAADCILQLLAEIESLQKEPMQKNEREAFEAWCKDYALNAEPNYSEATKADCWAAWQARAKQTITLPVKDATGEH